MPGGSTDDGSSGSNSRGAASVSISQTYFPEGAVGAGMQEVQSSHRVPSSKSLDPALQFLQTIPPHIAQGIRILAFNQLESVAADYYLPGERALIVGQALALSVIESDRLLMEGSVFVYPEEHRMMREVSQWISETMVQSQRESIFKDILKSYHAVLTMNTREEIEQILAQFHPILRQRIEKQVETVTPAEMFLTDKTKELIEMGRVMGLTMETVTCGNLAYGKSKGLFPVKELEAMGVDLKELRAFRLLLKKKQGVDFFRASKRTMRAYLEMFDEIKQLILVARIHWGNAHPLVRSFDETYFAGKLDQDQLGYLTQAANTVTQYLNEARH